MRLKDQGPEDTSVIAHRLQLERNSKYAEYDSVIHSKNVAPLTEQEFGVLFYTAKGLSAKEISSIMFLAEETVKSYRKNLILKINARNTSHAVALAKDLGII